MQNLVVMTLDQDAIRIVNPTKNVCKNTQTNALSETLVSPTYSSAL